MPLDDWCSDWGGSGGSSKYVRYALCGRDVTGLVLLDPQVWHAYNIAFKHDYF